jgi:hypothetical protein
VITARSAQLRFFSNAAAVKCGQVIERAYSFRRAVGKLLGFLVMVAMAAPAWAALVRPLAASAFNGPSFFVPGASGHTINADLPQSDHRHHGRR